MQRPFLLAMILIASYNSLTQSPRKIDSNIVIADSAYNKDSLLALFINTIYKEDSLVKLSVDSTGSFINFFVYDIVDTANFQDPKMMDDSLKRVKFEDKHIYHFACSFFESSFSNIA